MNIRRDRKPDPRVVRRLIWNVDYFVRYIPLPYHIGGASVTNPDGTYSIYINSLLYADRQWEALLHEIAHCSCGHLDDRKDLPDEVKEWEADHVHVEVIDPDYEEYRMAING